MSSGDEQRGGGAPLERHDRDRDVADAVQLRNQISVTEVRNALRCPRIFALGRRHGSTVTFPVGASLLGATFHRIANDFVKALDVPPPAVRALRPGAAAAAVTRALIGWLLDHHLVAELRRHPELTSMPAEVDDLAEALRELARYLAADVAAQSGAPAESLAALVRYAEVELSVVVAGHTAGGGTTPPVRLVGRPDAVYAARSDRLEVVEYKLTHESNEPLDRAQVALYRYLLRESLRLDAQPVILRFGPTLTATHMSSLEADELTRTELLPLVQRMTVWAVHPEQAPPTERSDLCASCPLQAPCAELHREPLPSRDTPPAGGTRLRPAPSGEISLRVGPELHAERGHDAAGEGEVNELAERIIVELERQAVQVHVTERVAGPSLLRVEVSSPRQRVRQLDQAAEDVCHRLASLHDWHVEFHKERAKRVFLAPRRVRRHVVLPQLLARRAAWLKQRPGRFVLGEDPYSEVVEGDLSDAATCHLLVGGQTGSGKSVLLRGLIRTMAHYHSPAAIRFTLVDPKRVSFGQLRADVGAHLDGPILYDVEQVLPRLEEFVVEMNERYERFEQTDVEDIGSYNDDHPHKPLARQVIVVDEFQDLTVGKKTRDSFLTTVRNLGAKARAAGIHLVLATQRPDRKTVPGEIKTNLVGKIALKVQSAVNSRIILDAGGAETLLGRGDLLADLGHGLKRAQAPLA